MEHLPHSHGHGPTSEDISQQLRQERDFQAVADIFRQIGDPTRVRIFWLLCHCEQCVMNISALMEMSSPAVSHHLRPLKDSGLIVSRRDGREVYYRAADTPQSLLLHQMIEQVMEIACPETEPRPRKREQYHADHVETVRSIHDYLLEHMDRRVTIDALAKEYLMNPTTLKSAFKSVYGESLAAHIKEHRLREAARLLVETDLTVNEVAARVGYDSQSKFTTAFKAAYGVVPKEYRKK